ncbi:hypothetical protein V6N13_014730 [Hibiscus sabdariffa]|uniref:Uncharacterized protein n=1 Tax=Hibiscus sabdariffa TaxID=183260 RepID=A0ABR2RWA4_9ROSI
MLLQQTSERQTINRLMQDGLFPQLKNPTSVQTDVTANGRWLPTMPNGALIYPSSHLVAYYETSNGVDLNYLALEYWCQPCDASRDRYSPHRAASS